MVYQSSPFGCVLQDASLDLHIQRISIKAEVVFGVESMGCKGTGICKMFVPRNALGVARNFCHAASLRLFTDDSNNLIAMVDRASMRKATIKKYFEKAAFQVSEEFFLPDEIKEQLTCERNSIKEGLYVSFRLQQYHFIIFPEN